MAAHRHAALDQSARRTQAINVTPSRRDAAYKARTSSLPRRLAAITNPANGYAVISVNPDKRILFGGPNGRKVTFGTVATVGAGGNSSNTYGDQQRDFADSVFHKPYNNGDLLTLSQKRRREASAR
jgi:hypothetical protein